MYAQMRRERYQRGEFLFGVCCCCGLYLELEDVEEEGVSEVNLCHPE